MNMSLIRIEQNELFNKARTWLEENGVLTLSSVMENSKEWYTLKFNFTSEDEIIIRGGNDSVTLIISLYIELN